MSRGRVLDERGDRMVPVSRLHLNLANPRHEPVESEEEAMVCGFPRRR